MRYCAPAPHLGPLHGILHGVKDLLDTAGISHRLGAPKPYRDPHAHNRRDHREAPARRRRGAARQEPRSWGAGL